MKFCENIYRILNHFGSFLQSPLLLLCRLYWGTLFMLVGWDKLQNIAPLIGLLKKQHVFFPELMAYLVAFIECFGGICLILGLGARLAALPLAVIMSTAFYLAHFAALKVFFTNPTALVAEEPFNYLLASLLILAFGPGCFSVDFLLEKGFFTSKKSR